MGFIGVVSVVIFLLNASIWADTRRLPDLIGRVGHIEGVLGTIQPTVATLAQTATDLKVVANSLIQASQPIAELDENMKKTAGDFDAASQRFGGLVQQLSEQIKVSS